MAVKWTNELGHRVGGGIVRAGILVCLGLAWSVLPAASQLADTHAPSGEFRAPTPAERFRQDSSRDNLVHPEGYVPAPLNTLGRVDRHGDGPIPLVLVAGLGFGGDVFDSLLEELPDDYTVYVVTLPGYGGSSAPPMPPSGTSYGERTWLENAERALASFLDDEGLDRPIVGALYSDAANVVAHAARDHPGRIGGVLLMSASARQVMPEDGPSRAERMDVFAERWFKTVTEIMWPSGMFPPDFYASDPAVAELAWWQVLEPSLPTSIRYQVETWATDLVPVVRAVPAPIIVLSPDFEFLEADSSRLESTRARFHAGWEAATEVAGDLEHRVVSGGRFLIWHDAPEAVHTALQELADRR